METKELAILPGIRVSASFSIDVTLPNGRDLHVSSYEPRHVVVVGEDGAEKAAKAIAQEVLEILRAVEFGTRGRP